MPSAVGCRAQRPAGADDDQRQAPAPRLGRAGERLDRLAGVAGGDHQRARLDPRRQPVVAMHDERHLQAVAGQPGHQLGADGRAAHASTTIGSTSVCRSSSVTGAATRRAWASWRGSSRTRPSMFDGSIFAITAGSSRVIASSNCGGRSPSPWSSALGPPPGLLVRDACSRRSRGRPSARGHQAATPAAAMRRPSSSRASTSSATAPRRRCAAGPPCRRSGSAATSRRRGRT